MLGLRVAEIDATARRFVRSHRPVDAADAIALLHRLWHGRTFEERCLAIELVHRIRPPLPPDAWERLDPWVDEATGWALSDDLAGAVFGQWVAADPGRRRQLRAWARSPNLWRRRASLYALGPSIRRGEVGPALAHLQRLVRDPERWVQRAVGTWLRECGKVDGPATRRFLDQHLAHLTRVALTVALERATPAERRRIRARAERARATTRTRPNTRRSTSSGP